MGRYSYHGWLYIIAELPKAHHLCAANDNVPEQVDIFTLTNSGVIDGDQILQKGHTSLQMILLGPEWGELEPY